MSSRNRPRVGLSVINCKEGCLEFYLIFLEYILSIIFDVELRLSSPWLGGNIGSTEAKKTCHNLKAYIFENNNRKVINSTLLDSLYSSIFNKINFNYPPFNPYIQSR
jgi:hypothetical protein